MSASKQGLTYHVQLSMTFAARPRACCLGLVLALSTWCNGCGSCDQRPIDGTRDAAALARSAATIPDDVPRPGARLRLQAGDRGEPLGIGAAWDTELSIRCTVQMGMDRRLHCLPERVEPNVRRVFLDAGCTQPIIEICSPDPKLAAHEDAPRGHPSEAARVLAGPGRTGIHDWALYPHPSHLTDPFYVISASSGESPKERYQLLGKKRCARIVDVRDDCTLRRIERELEQKNFVGFTKPEPTGPRIRRTYVDSYCQERGVFVCSVLDDDSRACSATSAP